MNKVERFTAFFAFHRRQIDRLRVRKTFSNTPRPALLIGWTALVILFALLTTAARGATNSAAGAEKLAHSVTIYRDLYGVPHVFGPTDASCVFGYAYAQAEDNFKQIEDSYIHAIGRAAEVDGESELPSDTLNRALEIPGLSQEEYKHASARTREIADAFAEGLNYFLAHNPQVHPRLITHFEPWYLFAFNRYALYQLFIFGKSGVKPDQIMTTFGKKETAAQIGSNMWAIMPKKSADGHAMLFINPHQPFFGPGQWYEGQVHSDEGWDMTGASFFGSPCPTIGHNEYLGWSHTVNDPDIVDVYAEKFDNPKDPLAYKYGDTYKEAVQWTETIAIKNANGVESKNFTFTKTLHGPVVSVKDGQRYTVRLAKLVEGGQLDEWYAMSHAHNMAEFKAAMSKLAVPMFNCVYADRDGNIFYVYNAAVPRRSTKFDWSKPVDGSNPETDWHGYHSFDELPQLTNPATGFVQNCNSTPFMTTTEGNPKQSDFPPYMVTEGDTPRAQISRRILAAQDKITFDDWSKDAFNTYNLESETYIPALADAVEKLKQSDPARAAKLAPAISELKSWNHISTVDSKAMTIFALWFEQLGRLKSAGDKDPLLVVKALEQVTSNLESTFGTWEVPWGRINRLERADTLGKEAFSDAKESLPVAGAPGWLGVVFNFYARPEKGQKFRYGIAGHSFVSVVDFGPKIQAKSILVFGENANPASPNYFDQSELYAKQEFKPAWFYLDDIKAHMVLAYHPGQSPEVGTATQKAAAGR
ncbi:MAG TPA: acylase [Blastocatellia bacterium]|nr:acylase [Blastocatellia bacterium]